MIASSAITTDASINSERRCTCRLFVRGDQGEPDSRVDSASDRRSDYSAATRTLTHCFLRLAHIDSGVFDRLGRYEAALWRQTVQTMFALGSVRRQWE